MIVIYKFFLLAKKNEEINQHYCLSDLNESISQSHSYQTNYKSLKRQIKKMEKYQINSIMVVGDLSHKFSRT